MKRQIILVGLSEEMSARIREAVGTHKTIYHRSENQRDTFTLVDRLEPSVVITGEFLPDGDGYSLCEVIKQRQYRNHVGVLIITAFAKEFDRSRSVLVGVDDYLEADSSTELLSDRILALAEEMEEILPLKSRPAATEGQEVEQEPADEIKKDENIMFSATQFEHDNEEKVTFYNIDGRTVDTAKVQSLEDSGIFHGYGNEEQAKSEELDRDPKVYHGVADATDVTEDIKKSTSRDDYIDPVDEFFADKEESGTSKLQNALPLPVGSKPLIDMKNLSTLPTLNVMLHGHLGALGPRISENITCHLENWVEDNLGRRVDDMMRQEIRKTIAPLVIRVVDQAVKDAVNED